MANKKPNSLKLSHWIAFFVHCGINPSTKIIAIAHQLKSKGNRWEDRYATLKLMEAKYKELEL